MAYRRYEQFKSQRFDGDSHGIKEGKNDYYTGQGYLFWLKQPFPF